MIVSFVKRHINSRKWRKKNPYNFTSTGNQFYMDDVIVGNYTYGCLKVLDSNPGTSKLYIGNYCSIAPNVTFILCDEHNINNLFLYPVKRMLFNGSPEATSKGDIIIGDDVWIGYGTLIMSGVSIGKGTVIGAGSVVTKSIPPYSVACGVPARVIRKRFDDRIISHLQKIDYKNIEPSKLKTHIDKLYMPIETEDDAIHLSYYFTNEQGEEK